MPVITKGTRPNTGSQTPLSSSKIPCGLHKSLNQQKKKFLANDRSFFPVCASVGVKRWIGQSQWP